MVPYITGSVPASYNPGLVLSYANQAVSLAGSYVAQLGTLAASLQPPVIQPNFTTPAAPPNITVPTAPSIQIPVWTAPAAPAAFVGSLNIDGIIPAAFDSQPPVLSFPVAPTFSEAAPSDPGVSLTYTDPTLNLNLPAPPSLLSISVAPFSGFNMPTVDTNLPTLQVVAPSVREYVPGALYSSTLLTSLKTALQDRILNGGTGLPPAVETAIWDRAREREYRQSADAIRDLDRMESLGYAFPPGVYLDARTKVQTELAYNIQTASRDIMIEQAKLEQANILKALETATQLEGTLIQYTNQVEQRSFEASKYATQAGIEIYNAQVRAYSSYVDAYKTKVAIYEAQVRAELAKVEAYKAQIEAEQAKAQVNTALVQQYRVQADVALSAIEVYKAQIAGIQAKAEIEKLKISIFGEQIRAYGAKVSAYTAGVEGFKALVSAEGAKQEAFKSQVQAYSAQVDAASKIAEAKIEEYKGQITAKTAEWEGYKAAAQAEASKIQALTSSNQSITDLYRAEVTGFTSVNEVLTKQWQVAIEQAQRSAEIGVAAAKANADMYQTTRSLALDASKVGAQVSAQIGAAAINAVNFSSSQSLSYSTTNNNNASNSSSYSSITTTSLNSDPFSSSGGGDFTVS